MLDDKTGFFEYNIHFSNILSLLFLLQLEGH